MKKIFTLAFMAFFCCLGMMAQVELGDIKFSIKDGQKVNPITGKIIVTFPDIKGVDDPTTSSFALAGAFNDMDFDGVGETVAAGATFALADFELEPSTEYTLTINSVKVDGVECIGDTVYVLNFKTRGNERKMSWKFGISDDEASLEQILTEATANSNDSEIDETKYQLIKNPSDGRIYVPSRNYEEIMLPDGSPLPMTEDLLFKFGAKSFYLADKSFSKNPNRICFNNNNQMLVIPDCKVGDVITFSALRSSKNNTYMQAMDGCAIAPDGLVSNVTGLQDSIPMSSSLANHKFEVQVDGDVTFKIGNTFVTAITIEESQEKVARNYSIVAAYADSVSNITLKELVAKTEGMTGSTIKANYPYWLVDAEGNAYTHGSKGNEFVEAFDLKNGEGDTIFVVNYKKTDFTGAVYLSEGEDIEGAVLCTNGNAAIRSSMGKAAYFADDVKLCTLQPGTYKVRAIIADYTSKSGGYDCVLTKGEGEENEIHLVATADNWNDVESDLLTITEATDITLKASGNENQGVDVIMIYTSTDAPDDAIVDVNADGKKAAVRKVMQNGRILIVTKAGTVNVAGQLVK